MSRRIDLQDLDWTHRMHFRYLPEEGLHILVTPVWLPQPGERRGMPKDGLEAIVVDVSAEDVAVVMAVAGLLSGPDAVPPDMDDFKGTFHSVSVFRGRSPGWHSWISRAACSVIIQYFEDQELQASTLGTVALRRFESAGVQEARDREKMVVEAVWRDGDVGQA